VKTTPTADAAPPGWWSASNGSAVASSPSAGCRLRPGRHACDALAPAGAGTLKLKRKRLIE
jgi:hypothetical protein